LYEIWGIMIFPTQIKLITGYILFIYSYQRKRVDSLNTDD
jgi:hypothetical protein